MQKAANKGAESIITERKANIMDIIFYLVPLFFIIAIIYSSVGFGGGSSYLAVMALFSFPYHVMPKASLLCNIVVVSGACWIFYKSGHLKFKSLLPFIIGSLPMAYLGGKVVMNKQLFLLILGGVLIAASRNLFFLNTRKRIQLKMDLFASDSESPSVTDGRYLTVIVKILIGAVIGFISGAIGIGGGILLAPVLYFTRWGYAKQIAAASCFFIFINSISGICGQLSKGFSFEEMAAIVPLAASVFIGGQVGSRLGAFRLSELVMKRATAILALFAGIRILAQIY